MNYMFSGPPSAGLSDEIISFYIAVDCKKLEEAKGDGHEQIITHIVPVEEAYEWLLKRMKEKNMVDLKVWTGIYFLMLCDIIMLCDITLKGRTK